MANEISMSAVLNVNSGTYSHLKSLSSDAQDLSSVVASGGVLSVADTEEAIPLGDLTTPGWAYFKNVSTTDLYIEIGQVVTATFYPFLKLEQGQFAGPIPLGVAAPYALCEDSGGSLEFYILEQNVPAP